MREERYFKETQSFKKPRKEKHNGGDITIGPTI